MRATYSLYVLMMSLILALLGLLLLTTRVKGDGWCYRGTVTYSAPSKIITHSYPVQSYSGYGYHREYVPYAVEVQVHKDRYYSLSDLYRDRLYLEAFDLMREMRSKLNTLDRSLSGEGLSNGGGGSDVGSGPDGPGGKEPKGTSVSPPSVQPVPSFSQRPGTGKTSDEGKKILGEKCSNCHNSETKATGSRPFPLNLDDPDKVPGELRWAAFGRAAIRNMPFAPKALREKGKEAELAEWQKKNSLTDEQLKKLFDGWVVAQAPTK